MRRTLTGPRSVLGAVLCLAAAGLAACGGTATPPPEPPDRELASDRKLARFALDRGQYDQSVKLYQRTLDRAYARDEAAVIAQVGYESAVALLRAGQAADAAARARGVREELLRRGVAPQPELLLTEAVALYASGDALAAESAATAAAAAPASADSEAIAVRAAHVRGMIAADRADAPALSQALAAMGKPEAVGLRADKMELTGRRTLLQADAVAAEALFLETADLRRDSDDYVGVARATAFAGAAAESAGQPQAAADLYLRAGRSAANLDRPVDAETWLRQAERIAASTGQRDVLTAVRRELSALND